MNKWTPFCEGVSQRRAAVSGVGHSGRSEGGVERRCRRSEAGPYWQLRGHQSFLKGTPLCALPETLLLTSRRIEAAATQGASLCTTRFGSFTA